LKEFAVTHGMSIIMQAMVALRQSIYEIRQTRSFCGIDTHHQDSIPEKTIRTCKGRILTIFNIHMKDSLMQGPMPSKPALIVKITLQQVNMTKCPMSRFGTTTNVPSIQNQHHRGYTIYVLKRTTTTIGQKN
jgi:hypothetical protein